MKTKSETTVSNSTALESVLSAIRREFGEGAARQMGSVPIASIPVLPTGSLAVDVALGVGGLPKGRIVEAYGPEGSGKTSLCLSLIAEAQRRGGTAAFIDVEHALSLSWAAKCGVDVANLIVSQPDSGEEALTIAERFIASRAVAVIVVDSVAALVPKSELEGQMGDATVGAQARLMSQAMRRLTAAIDKSGCVLFLANQLRERIGVTWNGPTEYQPGGRAVKFFASVRLDLRRKETIKNAEGKAVANRVRVKVVKNKVAPPYAEAELDLEFDRGIANEGTLVDLGIEEGLLEKKGAWISRGGTLIAQGRDAAKEYLRTNREVAVELERELRARLLPAITAETADAKAA